MRVRKWITSGIAIGDKIINTVFTVTAVLIVILGIYLTFDIFFMVWEASDDYYEAYKPVSEKDSVSFGELKNINSDVIGWLTVDNTNIDYPIVQGENNIVYINQSVTKEYSLTGAIFLDSRNSYDFSDRVSILYGHNMVADAMFGGIDLYSDKTYFDSHLYGTIFSNGKYYRLSVFAYAEVNGYDGRIYNPSVNEKSCKQWLEYLKTKSIHIYSENVPVNENIVVMSTCSNTETDGRRLLIAKLSETNGKSFLQKKNRSPVSVIMRKLDNYRKSSYKIPTIIIAFLLLIVLTVIYLIHQMNRKRKERQSRDGK